MLPRPESLSETSARLHKNLAHFRVNYAASMGRNLAAALSRTWPPSWRCLVPPLRAVPCRRAVAHAFSPTTRSSHGSNQLDQLSIEYPMLSLGQTTPPPATSMPTEEKKKATRKPKFKAKTQGKKKKKEIPVLPDSPVMSTRSKTPQRQSPAVDTRSKRKLPVLDFNS
ncbi:hypothetical protein BS78_10G146100 [Paspalum vaginatum]|nr:hypothetical protein BS78_10G146100 [Paspalum vaginatum]